MTDEDIQNSAASYSGGSGLIRHIGVDPENKKPKCAECHKEFKHKSDLNYHIRVQKCHQGSSVTSKDKIEDKIVLLEKHLADIDSQIETVAALISGLDSAECDDCFVNK